MRYFLNRIKGNLTTKFKYSILSPPAAHDDSVALFLATGHNKTTSTTKSSPSTASEITVTTMTTAAASTSADYDDG